MKIIIRDENRKKRTIPVPNFIVTSRFALRKLIRLIEIEGLSRKEFSIMARGLRKILKDFKGLTLVDVETSEGVKVKIYL